jgi:oxaloacetate decarboxylase alpha subunit
MYALFPNEAREYLQRHQHGAEKSVFALSTVPDTGREDDSVNVNQIRELVQLVENSDVTEIVVEEGDARIVVRKGGVSTEAAVRPAHPVVIEPTGGMPPAAESPQVEDVPVADGEPPATWKPVVAPMVGTFYRSPAPGSPAFVEVGDSVTEGQPLCILEAMKLMNEIVAEEAGVIRQVVATNAGPVEYGSVLFYYEPVA